MAAQTERTAFQDKPTNYTCIDQSNVSKANVTATDEKTAFEEVATIEVPQIVATANTDNDEHSTEHNDNETEDETKYPKGLQLALLTLGLCLATWIVALDNTIIATASKSAV